MKKFQLEFDVEDENNFRAIALYTDEINFRLAYLLNLQLSIHLKKSSDLYVKQHDASFGVFDYHDTQYNRDWLLLDNYSTIHKKPSSTPGLFDDDTWLSQRIIYLKTYKKAKYILKINDENIAEALPGIVSKIIQIPQIYTAETIDLTNEKNKKRLIF